MRLHVIGNSHIGALRRAHRELGPEMETRFAGIDVTGVAAARYERVPFSRVEGSTVRLTLGADPQSPGSRPALPSIEGDDVWAVCMGLHNITLVHDPFWNHHEPAHIAASGAGPVSPALMAEVIDAGQRHVVAFLLHLRAAGVRSFVVSSPPLRRDHPAVSSRRPEVTLEVDRLARQAMRDSLADHGIGFVDHPPEAVADDGFLREDWHAPDREGGVQDRHHANPAYGAVMLRRVIDFAEDRFLDPGPGSP